MATYKPLSKEEFVALPGIGEGIYRVCGEQFIKAIKSYVDYKIDINETDETQKET